MRACTTTHLILCSIDLEDALAQEKEEHIATLEELQRVTTELEDERRRTRALSQALFVKVKSLREATEARDAAVARASELEATTARDLSGLREHAEQQVRMVHGWMHALFLQPMSILNTSISSIQRSCPRTHTHPFTPIHTHSYVHTCFAAGGRPC